MVGNSNAFPVYSWKLPLFFCVLFIIFLEYDYIKIRNKKTTHYKDRQFKCFYRSLALLKSTDFRKSYISEFYFDRAFADIFSFNKILA